MSQSAAQPVMRVVRTRESLEDAYAALPAPSVRSARASRAAVFTMGALHAGHVELIRCARAEVGPRGHVSVTVFVNPLQFGPQEDLGAYPRTLDADLAICADEDVDLVFVPSVEVMYPGAGITTRIDPGPRGAILEGAVRTGHFSGVLTVVAKLLHLTNPQVSFFGEKDYQQLVLIRAMARELDFPTRILGVPTMREPDGLARSSRNVYLSAEERRNAVAIPEALLAGATAAELGRAADAVVGAAELELRQAGITPDYVTLTDPELGAPPRVGPARLLIAARVGNTRLIDNRAVTLRP